MLGYVAPYMEPSISPSTNMEAAFGRLHNSGAGAFGARPTVVESIVVDGEIDGSMYGTIYPSIYGSENGARNNNPSGRIYLGRSQAVFPGRRSSKIPPEPQGRVW